LVLDLLLQAYTEIRKTNGNIDDDVYNWVLEKIQCTARAASLRASQAHDLYIGIPDEYIDWEGFVQPYVCRVRGCRAYGHEFPNRGILRRHCFGLTRPHNVCYLAMFIHWKLP
jgi:hypothetical protein